ncbi:MAG TPA: DUF308 domain-containing protein [Fimbriimonadaceae bacterium]|jgi:uncharacterized membrane protein HdeD (DUF308 family)
MSMTPTTEPHERSKKSMIWAILMIVLGLAAIALPWAASIAVAVFVAWILILSGVVHIAVAFSNRAFASFAWKIVVGVVYVCGGVFMLIRPLEGAAAVTLFIAVLFFMEGIFEIGAYFALKKMAKSAWLIVDGIFSIVLGALIWAQWPASTVWAIGLLIGINLLMSGFSRLSLFHCPPSLAARHPDSFELNISPCMGDPANLL